MIAFSTKGLLMRPTTDQSNRLRNIVNVTLADGYGGYDGVPALEEPHCPTQKETFHEVGFNASERTGVVILAFRKLEACPKRLARPSDR
jgi:hypothetical protein